PVIVLATSEVDNTVDFGLSGPAPAAIGNHVFCDVNNDGLRDLNGLDNILGNADDEVGIENVVVSLFASNGTTPIDNPNIDGVQNYTSLTDADGVYAFMNLLPGSYVVKIENPLLGKSISSATTVTTDNTVDNDDNGSQSVPGGVVTSPVIVLVAGETDNTKDFGFIGTVALGDLVFCDDNNDGFAIPTVSITLPETLMMKLRSQESFSACSQPMAQLRSMIQCLPASSLTP
ncbi:MAG: hypothetical protein HC845_00645, partial [Akkermansiaceae bacterium]|nr:hypothetical protein [Akkermansiaceae bacterium]